MKNTSNKLVLGTVQFGLEYGINNTAGKPSRKDSLAMLKYAFDNGVKIFDTAYAYGDAEEILGEFASNYNLGEEIKIITKLKPNIISEGLGKIASVIKANLEESLGWLKRNYVDGYLLHEPEYIWKDEVVNAFVDLKKAGLVKNIGVSIYEEADAIYAAKLKEIDYIQIPYNIFDQRLEKTDFFRLTEKNNKTVFARSVFLQGLFLMPEDKIPPQLEAAKASLRELDEIIAPYSLSRQEAALLFSCAQKNIAYVVIGVDNIGQLKENLEIIGNTKDYVDCFREIKNKFINIDKKIITPSLWKK